MMLVLITSCGGGGGGSSASATNLTLEELDALIAELNGKRIENIDRLETVVR